MTDIELTRAAFSGIYSAGSSMLMDAGLASGKRLLVPDGVRLFLLHASGVISTPDENLTMDMQTLGFVGFPAGLMGVIVSSKNKERADGLLKYAETHDPVVMPQVHVVSRWRSGYGILKFINSLLAATAVRSRQGLARSQTQLARLRRDHEQLGLTVEKAGKMMRGIGLDTRTVAFELMPGDGSLGASGAAGVSEYVQTLPVDLTGFSGLALFVTSVSEGEGELMVFVRCAADKRTVATFVADYRDFSEGWHHFSLPEPLFSVQGNGELYLVWTSAGKKAGGPHFARTDRIADRFGDENHRSLALRVETGLAIPPHQRSGDETFSDTLARSHIPAANLFCQGEFYGGRALEEEGDQQRGWPVLTIDPRGGWLQTHPLTDGIAAFHVQGGLRRFAREISALVSLDHDKAAPCIAVLAALDASKVTEENVRETLSRVGKAGGLALEGQEDGLVWSAVPLVAMESKHFKVRFDLPLDTAHDLLLAAIPLHEDDSSFGWCRWREVGIGYQLPEADAVPVPASSAGQPSGRAVRITSFPDIAERIVFYRGRYAHDQLRMKLGFLPIQLLNDVGAMQMNPMEDQICAAELDGGLPTKAVRIVCNVGTAHMGARKFTYVLGVVSRNSKNRAEVIETVAKNIEAEHYVGELGDVTWTAVKIPAMKRRQIALDLPAWTSAGDIPFFIVLPAEGNRQFGWCRWYSLAIETEPDLTPRSMASGTLVDDASHSDPAKTATATTEA